MPGAHTLVHTALCGIAIGLSLSHGVDRQRIHVGRELLIGFDLLLVVVLGLLLYSISARDPQAPPNGFDALQLLLVVSA